jgi:hypothetical protein
MRKYRKFVALYSLCSTFVLALHGMLQPTYEAVIAEQVQQTLDGASSVGGLVRAISACNE